MRQNESEGARQQDDVRRTTPSTYSSTASTTASTGTHRSVRRVHMYNVATPPETLPEEYALSEASERS